MAISIKDPETDRLARALAVAPDKPLLFVGDDFSKTDVEVCPW